jgi:hypothetical protein
VQSEGYVKSSYQFYDFGIRKQILLGKDVEIALARSATLTSKLVQLSRAISSKS